MILHKRRHGVKTGMRHKLIYKVFVFVMGILFIYYILNYYKILQNEKNEKNTILFPSYWDEMEKEYNNPEYEKGNLLVPDLQTEDDSVVIENTSKQKTAEHSDCILSIPVIDLMKNVYSGSDRAKHLEQYELITATDDMQYKNGGNYIICGHASRLYGHSLNRIKEIRKGDIIFVNTADNTDKYIVNEVSYENMYNTSNYCNQTVDKTLTIISCAKYISDESYIVIHAELESK